MTTQETPEPGTPTITVTRTQLVELLDGHLPRMAFSQYGQTYNDDPDFDVLDYYERVVLARIDTLSDGGPTDG